MLLRPTTDADLEDLTAFHVDEPVSWISADRYREELAAGMYRPEWSWVAQDGGRIVARALWWGQTGSAHPAALDCLHVDRTVTDRSSLATDLLRAGHDAFTAQDAPRLPQYILTLPHGWRAEAAVARAVSWRTEAALAAGLTEQVERLRLEWTPECPLPAAPARLTFHEGTDEEFVEVFARVGVGSLDAETRRNVAAKGARATAQHELEFYRDCPGKREWWQIARDGDGAIAGFAIPSATPYDPNVGYLGVVPELRGRGLVDELLSQVTRSHAGRGAQRITATTDMGNAPMAAAFERAGYRSTQVRMNFSPPSD